MRGRIKILSFIGIVIFIFILYRINLSDILTILLKTNIPLLFLAISLNFIAVVPKALKWKIIVNSQKKAFSLIESIKAFFVGFAFSTLTPAKVGDFIKVFYISDKDYRVGKALSTIVIDRLIDIVLLLSLALIGIYTFSILFHIEILSIGTLVIIAISLILGFYIMLNKEILSAILRPFFNFFVPKQLKDKISDYYHDFFIGLSIYFSDRQCFFSSIFIGIVSWIPPFLYAYVLALSIGINVDIFFFVLVIPIISLLDLLPISISGIGTRDIALIFLFGLKGIAPEQAIAFSLIYLFLSYWLIALIGAAIWLKYPIKIGNEFN
ncbi:MAG: lysylphosphatidylglycerol synthase transmembrane domain-containing protein [Methanoregulaceae archaeon]|jgi:uncharacterized protein (TIRG00374 family)